MDKNQFTRILKRYSDTTQREAEEILSLKNQYPYSQLLHVLAARVSKDHKFTIHPQELNLAAVHATDRNLLRDIITHAAGEDIIYDEVEVIIEEPRSTPEQKQKAEIATQQPPVVQPPSAKEEAPAAKIEKATVEETKVEIEKVPYYHPETDDVAAEVLRDLKKLSKLKHDFEMLLVDYSDEHIKSVKETVKEPRTPRPKETGSEPGKSKKARIVELAKAAKASQPQESKPEAPVKERKRPQSEDIIDNIQKNISEKAPEGAKQQEQIQIINQFIKTQPTISSPKIKQPTTGEDLSPVKTGEFTENIISETLVEILIKQGKKDKAIEVLKKLIWKYPQKKAYFASQIEDLKK